MWRRFVLAGWLVSQVAQAQEEDAQSLAEEVEELRTRVEALERRVGAEQAREQQAAASRRERAESIAEALEVLQRADEVLERGAFEADAPLRRADDLLAGAVREAEAFGGGREVTTLETARDRIAQALEALGRRDFFEARRFTRLAFFAARSAQIAVETLP